MTATSYHHQHQHQRHNCRPLKILNGDDDVIFTRFKSQIIAKRKSAVELLQETKPLYVKSEIVLDRKQELRRSLRGYHDDQIANDSIDSVISTKFNNTSYLSDGYSVGHCCDSSAVEVGGAARSFPVVKSPRLIPPPPAFRKSTNSVQLQNELRKLLNGDSKENLLETNSVIDGVGNSSANKRKTVGCDDSKFYNARVSKQMNSFCHKSLPDLTVDRDLSLAIEKNDNASYDPTLCSVSSDGVCKRSTHTDCISLASCKNDCLYASTDISESRNDYDYFPHFADNTQESSPVKSCTSFITPPPLYCDNTESKNLSVSRSKSDVGVRTISSLHLADIPPCDSSNLNLFFDNLGLESDEYNSLTAPRSNASSPTYFLSDSSVISIGECASGSDIPPANHATQLPSIVERNARIIKWLCNCRKALEQIPRITVPQCR